MPPNRHLLSLTTRSLTHAHDDSIELFLGFRACKFGSGIYQTGSQRAFSWGFMPRFAFVGFSLLALAACALSFWLLSFDIFLFF